MIRATATVLLGAALSVGAAIAVDDDAARHRLISAGREITVPTVHNARSAAHQTVFLPIASASWEPLVPLGQIGGGASDIAVAGRLAAVAAGRRLALADITDLRAPRFTGRSPLIGHSLDEVVFANGYAWASVPVGPLLGFDVRNLQRPVLASITELPGDDRWFGAAPLASAAGRIYVGVHAQVHLVDVSDPRRPYPVGSIALPRDDTYGPGRPYALAAHGDRVYAVAYFGDDWEGMLVAIDWSEPEAPRIVGDHGLRPNPTYDLAVAGTWLMAARGHVEFIDVSDPANLKAVGWAGEDDWEGVLQGERLPGIDRSVGVTAAYDDRVWLGGNGRLWQLLMHPRWPPEIASTVTGLGSGRGGMGPGVLAVLDGGDITRLTTVDTRTSTVAGVAERLGGVGTALLTSSRAYVGGGGIGGAVTILDVNDPYEPRIAGRAPINPHSIYYATDHTIVEIDAPRHVRHWDVRDPRHPRVIAEHELAHINAYDSAVARGDKLYVPGHSSVDDTPVGGVFILQLDGSAPPRFWALSDPPSRDAPTQVTALRDRIVVGDESRYFVLDVTSTEPRVVSQGRFAHVGNWLEAFEVVSDHLIAADGQRLEVHRLTGPGGPALHAALDLPATSYDISVGDRVIVAAAGDLVVWEFDDNFRALRVLGEASWPAQHVDARDDLVAVGSSAGLRLFRLRPGPRGGGG